MDFYKILYDCLWFILPAYFANASALFIGRGSPIDFGRKFTDGRRILGDGKTFPGFLGAVLVGSAVGYLQGRLFIGFLLSLGAMFGDLVASFIKRRCDIKRGDPAPFVDQLDFLSGALLFAVVFDKADIDFALLSYLVVLTLFVHPLANRIAYTFKLKKVPY